MAYAGQTIYNPLTQETITFLRTSANTGGRMLQMVYQVAPGGGFKMPLQMHPNHEQRMYVKSGLMALELNGTDRLCRAPGRVIILPKNYYRWKNAGNDELRFVAEYVPAGNHEDMIEATFEIARRKAIGRRVSLMMALAVLTTHYKNHLVLAGIPIRLQKGLFRGLALAGRAAGYRAVYRYGIE